jgi:hypothetical protein
MAPPKSPTWRWHIGKPLFDYPGRVRWRKAFRWAWVLCSLLTLANILKDLTPARRVPVQVVALYLMYRFCRWDMRRSNWAPKVPFWRRRERIVFL